MVSDAAEVMDDRTDDHASSGSSSKGVRAWNLFRTAMLYLVAWFASSSRMAISSFFDRGFLRMMVKLEFDSHHKPGGD